MKHLKEKLEIPAFEATMTWMTEKLHRPFKLILIAPGTDKTGSVN